MDILIVEDEKITRKTLADILRKEGHLVDTSADGENGIKMLKETSYDVVVTDLRLPRKDGIEVLKAAKEINENCQVIVITAFATVETAVHTLKLGAYDYVLKPLSPEKFLILIRNISEMYEIKDENKLLKKKLDEIENKTIVGSSESMRKLVETVRSVAKHDYTVLIEGESGTGKEVIAKSLHNFSKRSEKPFIPINCAAIPESLLESELFGHEKGAFSGAVTQHQGYFERANQGTIFIDDIDDFPYHLQVKLLRVLQEKQIVRVGGNETISVDVRVVCATKISLEKLVQEKKFREDLYYRLHIIPIKIPPLRDRKEDIPELVHHFVKKLGVTTLFEEADSSFYKNLQEYDWPGNVRQLENMIERIAATKDFSVSKSLHKVDKSPIEAEEITVIQSKDFPGLDNYIKKSEKDIITKALNQAEQNISKAAKLLKIPRGTLRSKLKKLGIYP